MTLDEFETLLKQGESDIIEFKESLDKEAFQTISAFSNTKGGKLLIGICDDRRVKGITLGKETLTEWVNRIAQETHIHPQIEEFLYQNKTVVVMDILESQLKPIQSHGKYFKRVGKSTRQMTDEDLTRVVLGKCGMTWDEGIEPRVSFGDLDLEQFHRFRSLCNHKGRRMIPDEEDDLIVLEKLGLLQDGKLFRATFLMFGRTPQRLYPQSRVKIGRFRSETLIVDDREINGSLFQQVENTMMYFKEHLQTEFGFENQASRKVTWEYPLEALREAIVNAICHRDYLDNGDIQVRWYDENLTFLNPGNLPESLHIEELKRRHRSMPRNRKIAEIFFYAGLIEKWGSGTLKIIRECQDANIPDPEFEEKQGAFWLMFRKDIFTQDYLYSLGLTERQLKMTFHVKEKGRITNSECQKFFNVSKRTASDDLNVLETKDILERIGTTGRSTYYQLKNQKGQKGQQRGDKGAMLDESNE